MVWQRCIGFEHNQGLGGAELSLDKLNLAQHIGGWYPLFPMHSFGSDSNDSPWRNVTATHSHVSISFAVCEKVYGLL